MASISRKLFDDIESDDDTIEQNIDRITTSSENFFEDRSLTLEDRLVNRWKNLFIPEVWNSLFPIPTKKINIPINIVNELRRIRENPNEFGGPFSIEDNKIVSFTGKEGIRGELDMDIDPKIELMFHTHPPYTTRKYSPPSELDLALLFQNSVNSKRSIPHVIFTLEGIYVVYVHPQILNKKFHGKDLLSNLKGNIDFVLHDVVQDLRRLLGYSKERLGKMVEYPQKISIQDFIQKMNQMGFITVLHPYSETAIIIDIPKDEEILIGGGYKKYKISYQ